jgi:hypothetical protein
MQTRQPGEDMNSVPRKFARRQRTARSHHRQRLPPAWRGNGKVLQSWSCLLRRHPSNSLLPARPARQSTAIQPDLDLDDNTLLIRGQTLDTLTSVRMTLLRLDLEHNFALSMHKDATPNPTGDGIRRLRLSV